MGIKLIFRSAGPFLLGLPVLAGVPVLLRPAAPALPPGAPRQGPALGRSAGRPRRLGHRRTRRRRGSGHVVSAEMRSDVSMVL